MDRYFSDRVFLEDLPGLCVSIRRGEEIFQKAYGYSDYEKKKELSIEDIFHCASITKIVTARTAGGYDLDQAAGDGITLRMLLTHTSGLGDEGRLCEPGRRFIYSNAGYDILGGCIEKLSGMPFAEAAEQKVLLPAGMTASSLEERTGGSLALPHGKNEKKEIVRLSVYPYQKEHVPSACLSAPIGDLEKLADWCMRTMTEAETTPYVKVPDTGESVGLGWFIREIGGKTYYGHEGADPGFRTSFWICPEAKEHIILLSNGGWAPLRKMSRRLMER